MSYYVQWLGMHAICESRPAIMRLSSTKRCKSIPMGKQHTIKTRIISSSLFLFLSSPLKKHQQNHSDYSVIRSNHASAHPQPTLLHCRSESSARRHLAFVSGSLLGRVLIAILTQLHESETITAALIPNVHLIKHKIIYLNIQSSYCHEHTHKTHVLTSIHMHNIKWSKYLHHSWPQHRDT